MYENRVKGLHYQNDHLASIASNGDVTVWTIDIDEQNITELCSTNIGCRPICLTIIDLSKFADEYILKRENSNEDDETVKTTARASSAIASNKLGKVVIEIDDNEENDDAKKHKPKDTVSHEYRMMLSLILKFKCSSFFNNSRKNRRNPKLHKS